MKKIIFILLLCFNLLLYSQSNTEYSNFINAIKEGNMLYVKAYVESPNGTSKIDDKGGEYGETALMVAAKEGKYLSVVKLLIDNGANVNAVNNYGVTVLMYGSMGGNLDIVQLIIDEGANVNTKTYDGDTALMWAAQEGHLQIVKLLIDKGANVNEKNNVGFTPLTYAAGNSAMINLLKQNGAKN